MKKRKMFYFTIGVKLGDRLMEFSFDANSSSEARKKKQELYDMLDEILGKEDIIEKPETVSSEDAITIQVYPIEANVKLLHEYSNFWENGVIVEKVESPLLARIKKDTSVVFEITPREFEKVVTEIYYALGFEVELTPFVKDGGKDIIVIGNDENEQRFVHFIECKQHNTENPVGVSIVRGFESIVRRETANMGIIVTTAYFTKDAKKERKKYYDGVIEFEEFHKLIERIL